MGTVGGKPVVYYDDYHATITEQQSVVVRVGPWGEFETDVAVFQPRVAMMQSEFI